MSIRKKGKLSRTMLIEVALFALVLFLSVTVFLGVNYYYGEMQSLSDEAFAFARSAAKYIDGDKVQSYLESTTVNEDGTVEYHLDGYYDKVWQYLDSVREEHELMKYYYVFVPDPAAFKPGAEEDESGVITVTYLWDASIGEDASLIGDTEDYDAGVVRRMYNKNPEEVLTTYQDELWGNIACAFYPIYNSAGEPVAAAGVDLTMDGIRSALFGYILTIVLVVTGVVILSSIVFYLQIRKRLVDPIDQLNTATRKLISNLDSNESFEIDIHTGDELEELARSFGKMDGDLKDYIKRLSAVTAEKERIGAELDVASQIQSDMLPRTFPAFPDRPEFSIYATMTPAKEVGGDFYDFFLVDDDHLALVMADVSGKGVPAALFMVIAKTLIKNHAQSGESPAEILRRVNEQLCEGNEAEMFVTVWLAVIELSTGKGVAANAGHEHPAVRRAGGAYELVVSGTPRELALGDWDFQRRLAGNGIPALASQDGSNTNIPVNHYLDVYGYQRGQYYGWLYMNFPTQMATSNYVFSNIFDIDKINAARAEAETAGSIFAEGNTFIVYGGLAVILAAAIAIPILVRRRKRKNAKAAEQ